MPTSKFLSLYTFSLPFALVVCIPLAFFAVITTVIASSILAVRVFFVYLELSFAVISQYLLPDDTTHTRLSSRHSSHSVTFNNSRSPTPPIKRRSRRLSNGLLTPAASAVSLPVSRSIGPTRDFEGVGGWRLGAPSEDDDQAWAKINSRLELPAESPRRHHRRSLTGGNYSWERIEGSASPDLVMGGGGGGGGGNGWTPNTKRLRTPTLTMGGAGAVDSYFAIGGSGNGGNGNENGNGNGGSPKLTTRAPSAAGSMPTTTGSPVSSKSSGLTMKGRQ